VATGSDSSSSSGWQRVAGSVDWVLSLAASRLSINGLARPPAPLGQCGHLLYARRVIELSIARICDLA